MTDPQGPVIDWLAQLLAGLWEMVAKLMVATAQAAEKVEQKVADIAWDVRFGFIALCVLVVVHAVVTRRKP